jgi:hypothetical protein
MNLNDEVGRIWKEAVVSFFKVFALARLRESTENINQDRLHSHSLRIDNHTLYQSAVPQHIRLPILTELYSLKSHGNVLCGGKCKFRFGRWRYSGLFERSILVLYVVLFQFLPITSFISVVKHFNKRN